MKHGDVSIVLQGFFSAEGLENPVKIEYTVYREIQRAFHNYRYISPQIVNHIHYIVNDKKMP